MSRPVLEVADIFRAHGPIWRAAPPDTLNPTLSTLLEVGRSALSLRRLGKRDMLDLLRIAPMCVVDGLGEWFEDPLLKAGLALPAISGTCSLRIFSIPWLRVTDAIPHPWQPPPIWR